MGLILDIIPASSSSVNHEVVELHTEQIKNLLEKDQLREAEVVALTEELITLTRTVGACEELNTAEKTTFVNAVNEVLSLANSKARINDYETSVEETWSSKQIEAELETRATKTHKHSLDDLTNLRDYIFTKEEVINQINNLAMGLSWRPPVNSIEDLPESPQNGWACVVGDQLFIAIDEQWISFGDAFITDLATPEKDGLMAKEDKAKLNQLTPSLLDKLTALDLNRFEQLETKIADNLTTITALLGKAELLEQRLDGVERGVAHITSDLEEVKETLSKKANAKHIHELADITDWTSHLYNKEEVEGLIQTINAANENHSTLIQNLRSDLTFTEGEVLDLKSSVTLHTQALAGLQEALDGIDVAKLNALDLEAISRLKTVVDNHTEAVQILQQELATTIAKTELLIKKDMVLEAGLTQAQLDIQQATEQINNFIQANNAVVEEVRQLNETVAQKADLDHTHTLEQVNGLVEKLSVLENKDVELETELNQAQTDIQQATNTMNAFIQANNGVVEDIVRLKATDTVHTSQIGNLTTLTTEAKQSLVLAINELVAKLANNTQINDDAINLLNTWSSVKIKNELDQKSNITHEHGLHSINDWRTHLYDKTQVDDLLNALALGFTWKAPVNTVDDLPVTAELGWACIVGGRSLYVFSEEGWTDLGISYLPPIVSQDYDGLMSRQDKIKLDGMDANKLAQLDLTHFNVLDEKVAQNIASITTLLSRVGVNEQTIIEINQVLTAHRELLDNIDVEKLNNLDLNKIEKLGTDLTNLTSTVNGITDRVSTTETDLATQKERLDSFESRPRIYYQTTEPRDVPNGTFWIVGE